MVKNNLFRYPIETVNPESGTKERKGVKFGNKEKSKEKRKY